MSFRIDTTQHWPIIIPDASSTTDGLMSAADKAKLDTLGAASLQAAYDGGRTITVVTEEPIKINAPADGSAFSFYDSTGVTKRGDLLALAGQITLVGGNGVPVRVTGGDSASGAAAGVGISGGTGLTTGGVVSVTGGAGSTAGGALDIQGGTGTAGNAPGGAVAVGGGQGNGSGAGGQVQVSGGTAGTTGTGGLLTMFGGEGETGGNLALSGGTSTLAGTRGGNVTITGGQPGAGAEIGTVTVNGVKVKNEAAFGSPVMGSATVNGYMSYTSDGVGGSWGGTGMTAQQVAGTPANSAVVISINDIVQLSVKEVGLFYSIPELGAAAPTVAIASNAITLTARTTFVGAGLLKTINFPTTFSSWWHVIPTAAFTWDTTDNMAVAGTAVINQMLVLWRDSVTGKVYPSYV